MVKSGVRAQKVANEFCSSAVNGIVAQIEGGDGGVLLQSLNKDRKAIKGDVVSFKEWKWNWISCDLMMFFYR